MPRGKNYVNHNRGVFLKASQKPKHARQSQSMEMCFYGAGCTRRDCFYRHPEGRSTSQAQGDEGGGQMIKRSAEPCMAYLAGVCTFTSKGCRNRHPPTDEECERLIAGYKRIRCRYGENCRTKHCLYLHPGDDEGDGGDESIAAPTHGATTRSSGFVPPPVAKFVPPPMQSAWRPERPGVVPSATSDHVNNAPPRISAWRPEPHPAATAGGPPPPQSVPETASAWGGGIHHPAPPQAQAMGIDVGGVVAEPPSWSSSAAHGGSATGATDSSDPPPPSAAAALNVNAREFVPGGGGGGAGF